MSSGEGFSVTRPALISASTSAEAASDRIRSSSQVKLTGATPEAIAGHRDWQSGPALQACLDAWETRLRQLSAEVQQISQNLNATADGYDKAEAQAVSDIQQVAAGLNGTKG